MNALQLGLFQTRAGICGPYIREFIDRWADCGHAEEALAALPPRGMQRIAEWAQPRLWGCFFRRSVRW